MPHFMFCYSLLLLLLLTMTVGCKPSVEPSHSEFKDSHDVFLGGPRAGDVKDVSVDSHPPLIPSNIGKYSQWDCAWDITAGLHFDFYYNTKESVGGITGFFGSTKDVLTKQEAYRGDDVPSRMLKMNTSYLEHYLSRVRAPYGPQSTDGEKVLRAREALLRDLSERGQITPHPIYRPLILEGPDGEPIRLVLDRSSVFEQGRERYLLMNLIVTKSGKVFAGYRPEGSNMGRFAFRIEMGHVDPVGTLIQSGSTLSYDENGVVVLKPEGFSAWQSGSLSPCSDIEREGTKADAVTDF